MTKENVISLGVMMDYWIYIFVMEANSNQKSNFLIYKSVKKAYLTM